MLKFPMNDRRYQSMHVKMTLRKGSECDFRSAGSSDLALG